MTGAAAETKKLGKEFLATVSSGDRLSTMSYEQLREEARKSVEKIGNGATLTENFEEGLPQTSLHQPQHQDGVRCGTDPYGIQSE